MFLPDSMTEVSDPTRPNLERTIIQVPARPASPRLSSQAEGHKVIRAMPKRYRRRGGGRVLLLLLGLAGLGLGVWLFGRRGRNDWAARRDQNGR